MYAEEASLMEVTGAGVMISWKVTVVMVETDMEEMEDMVCASI